MRQLRAVRAFSLVLGGMVACNTENRSAETRGTDSVTADAPVSMSLALETRADRGGGPMTYEPGDVRLPEALQGRTLLEGALSTIERPADVIGRVVDLRGQMQDGVCTQATVSIRLIPPGSVMKADAVVGKAVSNIHYSAIIEKQQSAEVGYLVFAAKMTDDERAEVIIEDVADYVITDWNSGVDSAQLRLVEARPLAAGACGRYAITRVVATNVKNRYLRRRGADVGITAVFKLGGRDYRTNEKMSNDLRVAMMLQPLNYGVTPAPGDTTKKTSPKPPNILSLAR